MTDEPREVWDPPTVEKCGSYHGPHVVMVGRTMSGKSLLMADLKAQLIGEGYIVWPKP